MAILPRIGLPGVNAPSSLTRNHVPNSCAFERARHTRLRGARSTTRFSIRSVVMVSLGVGVWTAMALLRCVICNCCVAYHSNGSANVQPLCCALLPQVGVGLFQPVLARRTEDVDIEGILQRVGLVGQIARQMQHLSSAHHDLFALVPDEE